MPGTISRACDAGDANDADHELSKLTSCYHTSCVLWGADPCSNLRRVRLR